MNSLLKSLTPLAVLAAATLGAQAADFPVKDKPITIVVPFTASLL
jgi:tripartite-type tricarboxylate transporter receptor subunit TctC